MTRLARRRAAAGPTTRIASPREAFAPGSRLRRQIDILARGRPTRAPAWLSAWYEAYADPEAAPVILAQEGGRLHGLLALHEVRWGPARLYRTLAGTTNGQSRYTALLLHPAAPPATLPALLDAAAALAWDYLQLPVLEAPLAARVAGWAEGRGIGVKLGPQKTNALHAFWPDRRLALPRPTKKSRARERILADLGDLRFEAVTDPAALPAAIEAYLEAEHGSWKAERGELLSDDPRTVRFLRALAAETEPPHALYVHFLRLDGAIIAGALALRHGPGIATTKVFFREDLRRYAPGLLLDERQLGWIADETDAERIDFYTDMRHYDRFSNAREALRSVTLDRLPLARAVAARALRPLRRLTRR